MFLALGQGYLRKMRIFHSNYHSCCASDGMCSAISEIEEAVVGYWCYMVAAAKFVSFMSNIDALYFCVNISFEL